MNVNIEIVDKCSGSDSPVIDIIAKDLDSAFELGELYSDLFNNRNMDIRTIDGPGIRILMKGTTGIGLGLTGLQGISGVHKRY